MTGKELTISEVLHDPMIRLMLRADRISLGDFAKLLEEAANARRQAADPTNFQASRPH